MARDERPSGDTGPPKLDPLHGSPNGSNPPPDAAAAATTLADLRGRYRPPAPDPGFVARLEEDLMSNPLPAAPFPLHVAAPAPSRWLRTVRMTGPGPMLATAALFMLTLAAVFASFGSGRSHRPTDLAVALPAAPIAAPPPGSPAAENAVAAFVWESAGGPDTPLSNAGTLAIDPGGNLWVADPGNDRFQILSPDGAFLETWGTSGSGDGEFAFHEDFPTAAVAFAADGSFYVVDAGNRRVQKFAPDRSFVAAWGSDGTGPGQFKFPFSVAVDRDGRVYVLDAGRHDLQVFDADGAYRRTIGAYGAGDGQFLLSNGGGVAVDPAGSVWVSDASNNRIQVFSADGDLMSVISGGPRADQLGSPVQVAFDAAGRVFVASADTGQVQVFSMAGSFLGAWGGKSAAAVMDPNLEPGALLAPTGIALDGAGGVYVSDVYRDRVIKFRLLPLLASTPSV